MALTKANFEFSIDQPLPPFIAKVYALLDRTESRESIQWADKTSIHMKNPSKFEKIILPRIFAGLPLSKFYERMEKYGYFIDTTCLLEGTMLRLKIIKKASKKPAAKSITPHNQEVKVPVVTNKPPANALRSNGPAPHKENYQVEPLNNSNLVSKDIQALEQYRKVLCDKIYLIQDELNKIKDKYPDKAIELTNMIKYTNGMLKIASAVVPPK